MLRFMKENRIPSPNRFSSSRNYLGNEIEQALTAENVDLEQLQRLIANSRNFVGYFEL